MQAENSPYLIAEETLFSNKEARAYTAWKSSGDAEQVARELDVDESTAWSYKYRVNDKLKRARRTVSLQREDGEDLDDPEEILDATFFNRNARGRRGGREHALQMVEAHVMHEQGATLADISLELGIGESEADQLLGEAAAIKRRAEQTVDELSKLD